MALTCSVLGHAYGDPTVERDREERGSEVVVTIREYETCRRCGTARIVSENKEVTAVEAEPEGEPTVGDGRDDVGTEDAVNVPPDLTDAGSDAPVDGPAEAASEASAADDQATDDPVDEGAEIMDAEAGEPVDEELAAPSVADPPEAPEPTPESPPEDDGVVLDADDADADAGRAPGEWPDEDEGDDEPEWTPASEPTDADPEIEDSSGRTVTVPEGEFRCDECGYATPVEASSLRAGDFCPECHRGTLQHARDE